MTKLLVNRLNSVLGNLISREQSGFSHGCSLLDNIIVVQEIAHSINLDGYNRPRMLLKWI